MFDDIGLGKFLANSLITIGMLFLLIADTILIYVGVRFANWIFVSIILNIISSVYFTGYAAKTIVSFNLFYWPLANLLFIIYFSIKNIVSYRKNRDKYRIDHKQSRARKIIIRILLAILFLWFLAVVGYFLHVIFSFFRFF